MSARAFCTVTASTKRNATVAGNKLGAAVTNLASLAITPLWPVSNQTLRILDLDSPRQMKECFHVPLAGVALPDVKERDLLIIGANSYPVDFVGEWTDGTVPCLQIVVGEVIT